VKKSSFSLRWFSDNQELLRRHTGKHLYVHPERGVLIAAESRDSLFCSLERSDLGERDHCVMLYADDFISSVDKLQSAG
jgi:hypothetical protein